MKDPTHSASACSFSLFCSAASKSATSLLRSCAFTSEVSAVYYHCSLACFKSGVLSALTATRSCHLLWSTLYLAFTTSCFVLSGLGGKLGFVLVLDFVDGAAAAAGATVIAIDEDEGVGDGEGSSVTP
jgi:hypothetical protein